MQTLDTTTWAFARTGLACEGIEPGEFAIAGEKKAARSGVDTFRSSMSRDAGVNGEGTG